VMGAEPALAETRRAVDALLIAADGEEGCS
jgi:hypothetical protein